MPRRQPKYRRHATGQAFVQIDGRYIYLGKYDSPESRQLYHKILAELAVGITQSVGPSKARIVTVAEVLAEFFEW